MRTCDDTKDPRFESGHWPLKYINSTVKDQVKMWLKMGKSYLADVSLSRVLNYLGKELGRQARSVSRNTDREGESLPVVQALVLL